LAYVVGQQHPVGQRRQSVVQRRVSELLLGTLQVAGHSVEGVPQFAELIPTRQGDAVGQRLLAQPAGGLPQGFQRSQHHAGQVQTPGCGQGQPDEHERDDAQKCPTLDVLVLGDDVGRGQLLGSTECLHGVFDVAVDGC
jgi:hypothetical protein